MDTTQTAISNNLIANNLIALGKCFSVFYLYIIVIYFLIVDPSHLTEGTQPSIHPGCISSTGRGRVAASPTSTHTAQLIGGAISPSLFTSPNAHQVCTFLKLHTNKVINCCRLFAATTIGNGQLSSQCKSDDWRLCHWKWCSNANLSTVVFLMVMLNNTVRKERSAEDGKERYVKYLFCVLFIFPHFFCV